MCSSPRALPWSLLTSFVTEATGLESPCMSYVGQAELGAKTAALSRATRQVRERCQHGGDGLGWHRALFAHPGKEEINIDAGLLRHSLGKPAEPRLQPWPNLTFTCLPTPCLLPGPPASSRTPRLETLGQPFLPALWRGGTEAQREQGACFQSPRSWGVENARAAPGTGTPLLRPRHQTSTDSVSPPIRRRPSIPLGCM